MASARWIRSSAVSAARPVLTSRVSTCPISRARVVGSRPAAAKALRVLEAAEVLKPLDERKKNRAVVFKEYLDKLREGTEL